MKTALRTSLFFAAIIAFILQVANGEVVSLTSANFYEKLQEGKWMVKFFAPWCGHCKSLAQPYKALSELDLGGARIAEVDCTKEQLVCKRMEIRGYPMIKVFSDNMIYNYAGPRDTESMAAFISEDFPKETGQPFFGESEFEVREREIEQKLKKLEEMSKVVHLDEGEFVHRVQNTSEPWFVKFYAPWCGHCKAIKPLWIQLSMNFDSIGSSTKIGQVDCTDERRLCSRLGVSGFPTLVFFKDGKMYRYSSSRNLESFTSFANGGWQSVEAAEVPMNTNFLTATFDFFADHPLVLIICGIAFLVLILYAVLVFLDTVFPEEGYPSDAKTKEEDADKAEPPKSEEAKKNE